jgi:hypothetical protein
MLGQHEGCHVATGCSFPCLLARPRAVVLALFRTKERVECGRLSGASEPLDGADGMVHFVLPFFFACLAEAVVPVGLLLCPSPIITDDLINVLVIQFWFLLSLCIGLPYLLYYSARSSKREHTNKMRRITEVEMAKVYREGDATQLGWRRCSPRERSRSSPQHGCSSSPKNSGCSAASRGLNPLITLSPSSRT